GQWEVRLPANRKWRGSPADKGKGESPAYTEKGDSPAIRGRRSPSPACGGGSGWGQVPPQCPIPAGLALRAQHAIRGRRSPSPACGGVGVGASPAAVPNPLQAWRFAPSTQSEDAALPPPLAGEGRGGGRHHRVPIPGSLVLRVRHATRGVRMQEVSPPSQAPPVNGGRGGCPWTGGGADAREQWEVRLPV